MNSPNSPIFVTPPSVKVPDPPAAGPHAAETVELLRQLVEVQKEQLGLARQAAAAADSLARWRAFLARWQDEFPDVGAACKQALPAVERVYLRMVQELTDRVRAGDDDLDNEFAVAEFLDRYGMRLSQLGTIIGQLSPIADAAPPADDRVTG
jgi:hypothetical protein